ncbi:amidase [Aliidiomarina minuta]|uniref:Amidase n=1 Tax=Aliidiomarina minuta TaxID=880057 RepID=A0A432W9R3_9GAMM|nr:amidase [Aliidiomarina minuta]RUO26883.1 amidase [Aliidiomarina minuta]
MVVARKIITSLNLAPFTIVLSLFFVGCSATSTELPSDQFRWTDTATVQAQLNSGELSSTQLVQYYLDQIAGNNHQGHDIRAIIEVNPEALEQARQLDEERQRGNVRSPLHGLPVVLKANIATHDELATTAGATVMKDFITSKDAALVTQLRDAGAIILGKANLSEWANFRGQDSISGWSGLGGQTRNPYVLTHNPCGSSSGSGAAVAADFSLLAIGTETDGSIMCPASVNGVVGVKATRGAVSGYGIIPIASAQDIAGPMTRQVFGAAVLLDAMTTIEAKSRYGTSLAEATKQNFKGESVVVVRAYDDRFSGIEVMTDNLVTALQSNGIEVIEVDEWSLPDQLYADEFEVLLYEFKRDLNAWLVEFDAPAQSMQAVIDFNEANADSELALFGQEYFEIAVNIDLTDAAESYNNALFNGRRLAEEHLDQYLKKQGASAILIPAYGPAWPTEPTEDDEGFSFGTSTAAAVSGYPSITLPLGQQGPLPLGLSVIGLPWSEANLFSLAALLETQLGGFKPPQFLPALEAEITAE